MERGNSGLEERASKQTTMLEARQRILMPGEELPAHYKILSWMSKEMPTVYGLIEWARDFYDKYPNFN